MPRSLRLTGSSTSTSDSRSLRVLDRRVVPWRRVAAERDEQRRGRARRPERQVVDRAPVGDEPALRGLVELDRGRAPDERFLAAVGLTRLAASGLFGGERAAAGFLMRGREAGAQHGCDRREPLRCRRRHRVGAQAEFREQPLAHLVDADLHAHQVV
ncbi:hypothetical protein ACVCH0_20775 [Burkholderia glumae]